jgi:maltose alpha-D-glucosyltransferase/alpha-amylase
MLRFLTSHGFANIARWPAGSSTRAPDRRDARRGGRLPAQGQDGWELTLDELAAGSEGLFDSLRELGEVTGAMHSVLGSDSAHPQFAPERPSARRCRCWWRRSTSRSSASGSDLPGDVAELDGHPRRRPGRARGLQALSHSQRRRACRSARTATSTSARRCAPTPAG